MESPLERVATPFVAAIPPTGVIPIQFVHRSRQVGFERAQDQMEMVRHQAERVAFDAKVERHVEQLGEKAQAIGVVEEDRHLRVAASDDVVVEAGQLDSEWSSHDEGASFTKCARSTRVFFRVFSTIRSRRRAKRDNSR